MNYDETLADEIGEVIENIKRPCSEFYSRHKKLLYSIVLAGSLARREVSKENGAYDADLLVVTRYYYNPILCRFLKPYLEVNAKEVRFDIGRSYPLYRLRKEKSLFLYDVKNNGVILAGNDVKRIIQKHSLSDLYPFESIRLLLNATCRLIFSLDREEMEIKGELNKAMRCCIDAYLLHCGQFAPTMEERKMIMKRDHLKFYQKIHDVAECDDLRVKYTSGRQVLLGIMNLMRMRLGFNGVESLVDCLRERSSYSFAFKLYTLAISRDIRSILTNPIFHIYAWTLSVLRKCERPIGLGPQLVHHKHFEKIWSKLPQPLPYS